MDKLMRNKNFLIGGVIILFLLLLCLLSLFYTPYPPNEMYPALKFTQPGNVFLLGSDNFGRDILSRVMVGIRTGFITGSVCVFIGMFFGVLAGAFAGYYGGAFDFLLSRVSDALMAFPTVLLALLFVSVFGGGMFNTLLALGIMGIPRFARLSRGAFMQARSMEYVLSAKLRGASDLRVMFVHILPNVKSSLVVNASFSFSASVLAESGLSYLGLGIQPPHPSLGRMLFESQPFLAQSPWYTVFTGLAIVLLVLGFNMLGDGINETLNK